MRNRMFLLLAAATIGQASWAASACPFHGGMGYYEWYPQRADEGKAATQPLSLGSEGEALVASDEALGSERSSPLFRQSFPSPATWAAKAAAQRLNDRARSSILEVGDDGTEPVAEHGP